MKVHQVRTEDCFFRPNGGQTTKLLVISNALLVLDGKFQSWYSFQTGDSSSPALNATDLSDLTKRKCIYYKPWIPVFIRFSYSWVGNRLRRISCHKITDFSSSLSFLPQQRIFPHTFHETCFAIMLVTCFFFPRASYFFTNSPNGSDMDSF